VRPIFHEKSVVAERPAPSAARPQGLCLDKGYDYAEVRALLQEFGFPAHIRSRGEEAKALARGEPLIEVQWDRYPRPMLASTAGNS
jgi:putative transposase